MKRSIIPLIAICIMFMISFGLSAQQPEQFATLFLRADIISNGSTSAIGGNYQMRGTIGQTTVDLSTGSNYRLSNGFWRPVPITARTVTLTVTIDGTGNGTVTSSPVGIECGTDCTEIYAENTVVTLTATADAGSTFTGWSGACTGTSECIITMTEAQNITATFTGESDEMKIYLPLITRN